MPRETGRYIMTTILSGRQPVKGALLSDQPVERLYFSQTAFTTGHFLGGPF